jgi:hypothetical protein
VAASCRYTRARVCVCVLYASSKCAGVSLRWNPVPRKVEYEYANGSRRESGMGEGRGERGAVPNTRPDPRGDIAFICFLSQTDNHSLLPGRLQFAQPFFDSSHCPVFDRRLMICKKKAIYTAYFSFQTTTHFPRSIYVSPFFIKALDRII